MRTTLDLEDRLFRAAKARAAERGETLTSFVESALRDRLREGRKSGKPFRFRPLTKRGRVPPAVDVADRDALYEWMEGRR
ncbi:MAG: CopG family transcriptional regulator [Thermoanaerobaculia bacterium]